MIKWPRFQFQKLLQNLTNFIFHAENTEGVFSIRRKSEDPWESREQQRVLLTVAQVLLCYIFRTTLRPNFCLA